MNHQGAASSCSPDLLDSEPSGFASNSKISALYLDHLQKRGNSSELFHKCPSNVKSCVFEANEPSAERVSTDVDLADLILQMQFDSSGNATFRDDLKKLLRSCPDIARTLRSQVDEKLSALRSTCTAALRFPVTAASSEMPHFLMEKVQIIKTRQDELKDLVKEEETVLSQMVALRYRTGTEMVDTIRRDHLTDAPVADGSFSPSTLEALDCKNLLDGRLKHADAVMKEAYFTPARIQKLGLSTGNLEAERTDLLAKISKDEARKKAYESLGKSFDPLVAEYEKTLRQRRVQEQVLAKTNFSP